MKLTAWRIFKGKHTASAFTGDCARRFGGRWNSKGTAVIYTAGTASLAILELLVHLSSHQLLETYRLCEVTFDDELVQAIVSADLPPNWRSDPAPLELRQLGDQWIAGESSAVLRVPSVIVETEVNYLLNPAHPDFRSIHIGRPSPYQFDPRLIG